MLKVVCNVGLGVYGLDMPWLNTLYGCRVTSSLTTHLQMLGRILRVDPAPQGPRPYQDALIEDVFQDRDPVCIVASCGAGKSHIVAKIVKRLVADGQKVGYVVKRRGLVLDMCERLKRDGIEFSIHMPPFKPTECPVQVASLDTLVSRGIDMGSDVLILDEAHLMTSDSPMEMLANHRKAWLVGMSATPLGVGHIFKRIAMGPTLAWMIENGFNSDYRLIAPPAPDFSAAQTPSEYNQAIAGSIMSTRGVVGDVVSNWHKHARDGATLLFASSIEQSKAYRDAFNAAGILAAAVDASTSDAEREATWAQLKLSAKPKMGIATIIDAVGNCAELGYPEDFVEWYLDGRPPRRRSDDDPSLAGRHCPECLLFYRTNVETCPECGAQRIKTVREVKRIKGELEEIQRQRKQAAIENAVAKMDPAAKYKQLQAEAAAKGYKSGWAQMRFKVIFKRWPTSKERG